MLVPNIEWNADFSDPINPVLTGSVVVHNEAFQFDSDMPASLEIQLLGRINDNGAYWDFDQIVSYQDDPCDVPAVTSERTFTVESSGIGVACYYAMASASAEIFQSIVDTDAPIVTPVRG